MTSKEVEAVNNKELAIIGRTADGIRRALAELDGPEAERHLAEAMEATTERLDVPLTSELAGYYAAMYVAWLRRGRPDYWT